MRGPFFLSLAFLQVGLGWGLRADHSRVNASAGQDQPHTLSPPARGPSVPGPTTRGTGSATAEPETTLFCRGEEDCPPWSQCQEDLGGRNACRCELGYHLSPALGCVPARTFPARLRLQELDFLGWAAEELPWGASWITPWTQSLFRHILGPLDGYLGTTTQDAKGPQGDVTILHHFSAWARITPQQVEASIATFGAQCHGSGPAYSPACALLQPLGAYQSLDLCPLGVCDPLSTTCSFQDGLVQCSCRPGYFQAQAMDRTCTACGSGFWLQNGTCARCPFGFGGVGCQEPFLLALVIVSCLAGLLLLLLLFTVSSFLGKAQPPQGEPSPSPLPLGSPTSAPLPVWPPWGVPEGEEEEGGAHVGCQGTLALWDLDRGRWLASAPSMKTFLQPPKTPLSSAPAPTGGRPNLVFVSEDPEEGGKQSYF